jgi:hypothetical protein
MFFDLLEQFYCKHFNTEADKVDLFYLGSFINSSHMISSRNWMQTFKGIDT